MRYLRELVMPHPVDKELAGGNAKCVGRSRRTGGQVNRINRGATLGMGTPRLVQGADGVTQVWSVNRCNHGRGNWRPRTRGPTPSNRQDPSVFTPALAPISSFVIRSAADLQAVRQLLGHVLPLASGSKTVGPSLL